MCAKGASPGRLIAAISGEVVDGAAVGVVSLVVAPLVILLLLLLLLRRLSPGWTRGEGPSGGA